jgi:hypothetical protein
MLMLLEPAACCSSAVINAAAATAAGASTGAQVTLAATQLHEPRRTYTSTTPVLSPSTALLSYSTALTNRLCDNVG